MLLGVFGRFCSGLRVGCALVGGSRKRSGRLGTGRRLAGNRFRIRTRLLRIVCSGGRTAK